MEDLWVLTEQTRKNLSSYIMSANLDSPLTVVISDKMAKRSDLQNKYLFGWVYKIALQIMRDSGIHISMPDQTVRPYDTEILHEMMKREFLILGEVEVKGVAIPIIGSTAKMGKKPFSEFCGKVKQFLFDVWGIDIPEPPVKSIYDAWR